MFWRITEQAAPNSGSMKWSRVEMLMPPCCICLPWPPNLRHSHSTLGRTRGPGGEWPVLSPLLPSPSWAVCLSYFILSYHLQETGAFMFSFFSYFQGSTKSADLTLQPSLFSGAKTRPISLTLTVTAAKLGRAPGTQRSLLKEPRLCPLVG